MSAKLIVADAGPLIALAVGGILPTCVAMLGGLYVPAPVLQECTSDPSAPGAAVIDGLRGAGDLSIVPESVLAPLDAAFAQGLGTGELAVLSYAAENALLALIDERRARRVARHLKIPVIGSGTLLAQLKQQGLINSIDTVFAAWQQHGYFVSDKVKRDIVMLSAMKNS
jgi:predicted nucleic acid-binding protein